MAVNRAGIVDKNFVALLGELAPGPRRADLDSPVRAGTALTARRAIGLFASQVESRHLDLAARALKARNECFYTIGSSGHEGNAAVAAALRPDDPAFLHYRSGAFFVERARQVPGSTPLWDVLLGLTASKDEPIAGGRHKVFGSFPLAIPPQTSTIASHLPKAVGMALAIERAKRVGLAASDERITVATFGDASANHSTAAGAINAGEDEGQARRPTTPSPPRQESSEFKFSYGTRSDQGVGHVTAHVPIDFRDGELIRQLQTHVREYFDNCCGNVGFLRYGADGVIRADVGDVGAGGADRDGVDEHDDGGVDEGEWKGMGMEREMS